MKNLYRIYQLFVALPLFILVTIATCLFIIIGCTFFNGHFWGYWPGVLWGKAICRIFLLPVRVEGQENLKESQSYVYVANHQGSFDIFLIYGYLGRNFKWMMKRTLRQLPLVGKASESAGHIFVDKRGPKAVQKTYDSARRVLRGGTSLAVFPEGARTFTGKMGVFRKGAFQLAEELNLPVVPVTLNGCFQVLPRTRGFGFIDWHPLTLKIHAPIPTEGREMKEVMDEAYQAVMQGLPAHLQGYQENPDQ